MSSPSDRRLNDTSEHRRRGVLWITIALQVAIAVAILVLSWRFEFYSEGNHRPIGLVLFLLLLQFGLQLSSLFLVLQHLPRRSLMFNVFGIALLLRCILLFSTPIQEVDIYRYMWDGIVSTEGISPFRYAPQNVLQAGDNRADAKLTRLQQVAEINPGIRETLNRVHFPELPTVYPPSSQFIFALASWSTPMKSSIEVRLAVMKFAILLFDLGVVAVLWRLLLLRSMHPGWTIAYAWSPLILKEFANSGHLDAIAIFLTVATLLWLHTRSSHRLGALPVFVSAVLAGLAVGAKLYPILLFPLIAVYVFRMRGIRLAALWSSVAILATALVLAPMFAGALSYDRVSETQESAVHHSAAPTTDAAQLAGSGVEVWDLAAPKANWTGSLSGLNTFLTRWEMNDLLFMVVEENLRPDGSVSGQPDLWFVILPNSLRGSLVRRFANVTGQSVERSPFMLARMLTLALFAGFGGWLCWVVWKTPGRLLEACFLCLAWFWLLAPTQNPWYWTWALCLVPFARTKLWQAVGGLTLLYYWRFWFLYHPTASGILGTEYQGVAFFDFVVTWFEFGPFLFVLLVCGLKRLPNWTAPTSRQS